jgi:hypothetical protein
VELAHRVITLVVVVGFVPNDAVTPLGSPEAAMVTLPVNPEAGVTVIVSLPHAPWAVDKLAAEGASVKAGVAPIVSVMVVSAVVLPDVPVIVMVNTPAAAVLAADRVNTLVVLAGLVSNEAVTPLGRSVAASVTAPVNPPTSVTVIVSVALPASVTDRLVREADNVKPAVTLGFTVRAMVVLAVLPPDVPVIVTIAGPVAAVPPAATVTTLLPVVGFVPNVAVTPLGRPDASSVTLPVNPPRSVTVIVSVALLACVTESDVAAAASVKDGFDTDPIVQGVLFSANEVGTALVTLFHVPLNPRLV